MGKILLKSKNNTMTLVSNEFIDNSLVKLNEAQVKIYLYLLRHSQDATPPTVEDIADFFNYTVNDVKRSLTYMDKLGLLCADADKTFSAQDYADDRSSGYSAAGTPASDLTAFNVPVGMLSSGSASSKSQPAAALETGAYSGPGLNATASEKPDPGHDYNGDRVLRFKEQEDVKQLLYITETHMNKDLSLAETNTLFFIYDELGFSIDLIEYLVEYCANCGKRSMRYVEKVALSWADGGVTTVEEAKAFVSGLHYKECYAMLRELGITSRSIVKSDMDYINKWMDEYNMDIDMILEACRRNIRSISKPSFSYVDSILRRWHNSDVHNIRDIAAADAEYKARVKKSAGKRAPASGGFNNRFKNFKESGRDFNEVAKRMMERQKPL